MSDYRHTSQTVLEALLAGDTTPGQIAARTGFERKGIRNAMCRLRAAGLAENEGHAKYRITNDGISFLADGGEVRRHGPQERRTRTTRGIRARAWWLMRQMGRWTMHDLLTTVSDGSLKGARTSLCRYMTALEAVGVLRRGKRGVAVPGSDKPLTLWILADDLGRRAPVLRAERGELYDPNADKTYPLRAAAEAAAEQDEEVSYV